ncbi:MAG TPA: ABC transporter substrate-binding protein [Stellaceae bacterium]|jgi:putative ABC transport system substrate-binding protein
MNRREFGALVLCGLSSLSRGAFAADGKARIGYLSWFPESMRADLDRFREGMRQLGYTEGKTYEVEAYFTGADADLTRRMAQKLVGEPVDAIVVVATPAAHIVKAASQTIPIVIYCANALATGLVPSLAHPGGNTTGVSLLMTDLAGKRLDLLRQIRPSLTAVGFLGSTRDPNAQTFVHETQAAADRLKLKLSVRLVDGPEGTDPALFADMKRDGCEAVVVQPIFTGYQDKIVPMAMQAGLPSVSDWAVFADAGALMTYGAPQAALMRRTAYYVDRILKGARPGDLPVEQPTEFELVVNARTAARLGWTIPQDVLVRADRVIE